MTRPHAPSSQSGRLLRRTLPLAAGVILGGLLGVGFAAVIDVPRIDTLSDFRPSLVTQLLDVNGDVFATFARERRFLLAEDDVPDLLQQAILSGEDANFFSHGGVDATGVARSVLKNLRRDRQSQIGGSTLTMQLARKLYLTREKTWRRKIEEAFLTVEIEKNFSKQQILTLYSNVMYLGHGNYGMEAAARDFFGKSTRDLTAAEAATLVGILQRPSDYSPYRRPDLVLARRDYVLGRMREEGYLTDEEHRAAVEEPLLVQPPRREIQVAPYFAEEIRKSLEDRYGSDALLENGLRVQTTLDRRIQRAAEAALRWGLMRLDRRRGWRGPLRQVELEEGGTQLESWTFLPPGEIPTGSWVEGLVERVDGRQAEVRIGRELHTLDASGIRWTRMRRPGDVVQAGDVAWFRFVAGKEGERTLELVQEPELEGAVVVLESATGAVRAMVGGWSFDRSKFNRASQARRQVGSAFKPFVFGVALESGYTLADTFFDAPAGFPGPTAAIEYSPRNYYRDYYGISTLRRALELSMNVTSVKLLDLVGPERVVDFAHRAGIRSELSPYPSLALGAADLSPLEVASAYAAIANNGLRVEPHLVETVRELDGRILEQHRMQASKAMDPQIAFLLTCALEGVVDRGTAKAVNGLPLDLAGKTGTTDDYSDAWFAGFTPRYTVLTWVGHDVKRPIGRNMTGAEAALPIWQKVIEAGLAEGWIPEGETFVPPPGIVEQPIEHLTGFLPAPGAGRVIDEAFVEGTEPVLTWDESWSRVMRLPWYQQRAFYLPKAGERMPEDVADWGPILASWDGG